MLPRMLRWPSRAWILVLGLALLAGDASAADKKGKKKDRGKDDETLELVLK